MRLRLARSPWSESLTTVFVEQPLTSGKNRRLKVHASTAQAFKTPFVKEYRRLNLHAFNSTDFQE